MRAWIRLERGAPTATLHAVVHRLPRAQVISLDLARRLASHHGVPVVLR
ncbi:MAG TPA: hypothetical protein VM262_16920 [Acidimicrobiales bacterium]|nr:hypothetical protein [Acidimicrobiales bacterium]